MRWIISCHCGRHEFLCILKNSFFCRTRIHFDSVFCEADYNEVQVEFDCERRESTGRLRRVEVGNVDASNCKMLILPTMASYLTPHRRSLLLLVVVASIIVRTTAVLDAEDRPLVITVSPSF